MTAAGDVRCSRSRPRSAAFWKRLAGLHRAASARRVRDSWEAWARRDRAIPEERWNDQSAIVDPDGIGPRVYFQSGPGGRRRGRIACTSTCGPHPALDGDARRARLDERADGAGRARRHAGSTSWTSAARSGSRCRTRRATSSAWTDPGREAAKDSVRRRHPHLLERRRDMPRRLQGRRAARRASPVERQRDDPDLDPHRPREDQRDLSLLGRPRRGPSTSVKRVHLGTGRRRARVSCIWRPGTSGRASSRRSTAHRAEAPGRGSMIVPPCRSDGHDILRGRRRGPGGQQLLSPATYHRARERLRRALRARLERDPRRRRLPGAGVRRGGRDAAIRRPRRGRLS